MSTEYQQNFYIVPAHIRKLPGMTLVILDVYETIFQFWNHGKVCFLSNAMIMKRTGHSKTSVRDAFIFLEEKGEIVRKIVNGKRYLVQPDRIMDGEDKEEEKLSTPPRAIAPPPPRHGATPPRATAPHNNNNINTKNINKSTASHFDRSKTYQSKESPLADVTKQSTSASQIPCLTCQKPKYTCECGKSAEGYRKGLQSCKEALSRMVVS